MTADEFYKQLAEIALGWLGWSENDTLYADPNAILLGFRGRLDMLKAIFGGKPPPKGPPKGGGGKVLQWGPKLFDMMFRAYDGKQTRKTK